MESKYELEFVYIGRKVRFSGARRRGDSFSAWRWLDLGFCV